MCALTWRMEKVNRRAKKENQGHLCTTHVLRHRLKRKSCAIRLTVRLCLKCCNEKGQMQGKGRSTTFTRFLLEQKRLTAQACVLQPGLAYPRTRLCLLPALGDKLKKCMSALYVHTRTPKHGTQEVRSMRFYTEGHGSHVSYVK